MTAPAGSSPPGTTSGRARGYIPNYNPQSKTRLLLSAVHGVLEEYREHWPLTVRQIFYRLIGAHGYDKSEQFYGTLCHHLANARRGRVISFDANPGTERRARVISSKYHVGLRHARLIASLTGGADE